MAIKNYDVKNVSAKCIKTLSQTIFLFNQNCQHCFIHFWWNLFFQQLLFRTFIIASSCVSRYCILFFFYFLLRTLIHIVGLVQYHVWSSSIKRFVELKQTLFLFRTNKRTLHAIDGLENRHDMRLWV